MTGPRLWCQPLLRRESSIRPGDTVEVCGFLHRRPAPDGASTFDRRIPIEVALQGSARCTLLVRRSPRRERRRQRLVATDRRATGITSRSAVWVAEKATTLVS